MIAKKVMLVACIILCLSFVYAADQLDLGSILLKVSSAQGTLTSKSLSLSTPEGGSLVLSSTARGVSVPQNQVTLQAGEQKSVEVLFDARRLTPGAYIGSIVVESKPDKSVVPVIFEVESPEVLFDANLDVPPNYVELTPGSRLVANLKIFDLTSGGTQPGLGATKVKVDYYLYGLDGNLVNSESESVVVDRQAQVSKSIALPSTIPEGDYVFSAVVSYNQSVGVSSYLIRVSSESSSVGSFFKVTDWKFVIILGVIVVFFFSLIFLFVYIIRDRDALVRDLQTYHVQEFKNHKHFLAAQKDYLVKKGEKPARVDKEIQNKLSRLQERQEQQVQHLEHMKRTPRNEKHIRAQLASWRKAGYTTGGASYRLQGMSEKDMKSLMDQWKRRYKGI